MGIKLWSGDDLLVGDDVLDDRGVVGDAAVADLPVHDPQQRTQALGSGGHQDGLTLANRVQLTLTFFPGCGFMP